MVAHAKVIDTFFAISYGTCFNSILTLCTLASWLLNEQADYFLLGLRTNCNSRESTCSHASLWCGIILSLVKLVVTAGGHQVETLRPFLRLAGCHHTYPCYHIHGVPNHAPPAGDFIKGCLVLLKLH